MPLRFLKNKVLQWRQEREFKKFEENLDDLAFELYERGMGYPWTNEPDLSAPYFQEMLNLLDILDHRTNISSAFEKIKEVGFELSERGLLKTDIMAHYLIKAAHRHLVKPADSLTPLADHLFARHANGKLPTGNTAEALTSLIHCTSTLAQPNDLAKSALSWAEAQAQDGCNHEERVLRGLRTLFALVADDFPSIGIDPNIAYESENVAVSGDLGDTFWERAEEDYCVVFQKAVDANGEMMVVCDHGVLPISKMMQLAELHDELKGNAFGKAHIEFLTPFAQKLG